MLLAVFRYDFLDVNTMAFDKIFDSIAEAWWCITGEIRLPIATGLPYIGWGCKPEMIWNRSGES